MIWWHICRMGILVLLVLLQPVAVLADTVPPFTSATAPPVATQPETDRGKMLRLTGLMRQAQVPDVRIKIAQLLFQVKMGMPAETFYKRLAELDLPKEARFQIMEVKKDIGNVLKPEGLRYFLGEPFSGGGTSVEKIILTWRRQLVKEGIREVMKQFMGRNRIDGYEFKVYYAEIGGWATENADQMRFEGDIDFSFVCGNRMLAWQMKLAFDSYIQNRLGLSGQQIDAVCTAHGMAEPEVYVGRHGAVFAERAMNEKGAPKLTEIDLDNGDFGGKVDGAEVLTRITLDSKKMGRTPDLPETKSPTEPGISMEMVRHFLHDIMHNPVYTDIDSFLKAAKYTFRSNDAVDKAFGLSSSDPELAGFVKTLLDLKKAGSAAQIDAIKAFFGGNLPWGTRLGPVQGGKSRVTLFANKTLLDSFWSRCRDAMWKNAEAGFKTTLGDLKSRAGKVAGPADAAELKAEMDAVLKMMEIEFLLFDDPKLGGRVPASVRGLMADLRSFYKGFMEKWKFKILTTAEMEEFRFLEDLLKQGGEWNIKTAVATLLRAGGESIMRLNMYLDMLDDHTLGHLRGETNDFNKYMRNTWKKALHTEWARQGRGGPMPAGLSLEQVESKTIRENIETWMTNKLHGNCVARKIRNVNMILGDSIKSSAAGRAAMTGLIAVNLAQEIPAYIKAYNEEGWKALATEFFRRRVPFGSVTEHAIMGRYGMAAWDTLVTFVPPLALFQVAGMIGAGVADQSWKIFWSSELEYFVDQLYEDATFVLEDTERISQDLVIPKWRLAKIKYRELEVDVEEFKLAKQEQIRTMIKDLETPHREREFHVEYRYDGLTGIMDLDQTLRINLEDTDNFLYMLREMMQHPSVGEKLKDHLMDQWLTRWEQVKLLFILKTIAILEERRKVEQLRQSGKMEEVAKELDKTARKLKIEKEIEKGLEQDLSYDMYRYFKYLKDLLVGLKREFYGQPDVWDEYEEDSLTMVRYLETYLEIVQAREKAEEEFALNFLHDRGLRYLTGPYFLKGKEDRDKTGHLRWKDLPQSIRAQVTSELETIKGRYFSPSSLEEEGFDRQILNIVSRHDVWREAWRHVNSMGLQNFPDALAEIEAEFSEEELKADPNPAVARHRFHTERRDKLIEEFEEYYKKREGEGQPEPPSCNEELKKAQGISAQLKELQTSAGKTLAEARQAGRALEELPSTAGSMESLGQRAQSVADKTLEEADQAKTLREKICRLAEKLKSALPEEQAKALREEMAQAGQMLKSLEEKIGHKKESLDRAATKAEKEILEKKNLPRELSAAEAALAELSEALSRLREAFESLPELPGENQPRDQSQDQASDQNQDPTQDRPQDCPVVYRLLKESLQAGLEGLEAGLSKAMEKLKEQQAAISLNELMDKLDRAGANIRTQADRAGEALDMAAKASEAAGRCVVQAEKAAETGQDGAIRQALKDCRFKEAREMIKALPRGEARSALAAEYSQAQKDTQRTRELYQEAQSALNNCDFQGAVAKINEALALAVCDKHLRSLNQSLVKAQEAARNQAQALALADQARADLDNCRFDDAAVKLAQAREKAGCQSLKKRIRTLSTELAQARRDAARVGGLIAQGESLLNECQFKEAVDCLEQALQAARCAPDKAKVAAALTRAKSFLGQAQEANGLYKKGLAELRSCRLEAAEASARAALGKAGCAEHKAKINKLLGRIQTVRQDEEAALSLLAQARGLSGPGSAERAREMLTSAAGKARCPGTKARIESTLAGLGAEPPGPGLGPGLGPGPGTEEAEPFYVTAEIHLPWPMEIPEPIKPPQGADKAARERIKRENERRLKEFVRNLNLSQCRIISLTEMFKAPPILIMVRGEGLKVYPRDMFVPGKKMSMAFSGYS